MRRENKRTKQQPIPKLVLCQFLIMDVNQERDRLLNRLLARLLNILKENKEGGGIHFMPVCLKHEIHEIHEIQALSRNPFLPRDAL